MNKFCSNYGSPLGSGPFCVNCGADTRTIRESVQLQPATPKETPAEGVRSAQAHQEKAPTSPQGERRGTALAPIIALSISGITAIATIPYITKSAGLGTFAADSLAQVWTLAILMLVAAPVRTVGWRPLISAACTGFLGLTALSRLVGRPVVVTLGQSDVLATAVWVPLTEELIKAIPLVFFLVAAARQSAVRPSALDTMLLGAWTGAGFALYENAVLGRGGFYFSATHPLSLLFPNEINGRAVGWSVTQAGHLEHTALIGLGLGLAFLYRHRLRYAWVGALLAGLAVLIEHGVQNALALSHINTDVAKLALGLTLGGSLSSMLLLAGLALVLTLEWRAVGIHFQPALWARLPLIEASRRAFLLARVQHATVWKVSPPKQGVA